MNHFFKVAFRNIRKRKLFSFINMAGMALGLTVCLLAILWIRDETRFDIFHTNGANIAQVYSTIHTSDGGRQIFTGSYYPLARELAEKVPEVTATTRLSTTRGLRITVGEKSFSGDVLALADAAFFKIFTFPLIEGDAETALADKFCIVISESMRRKFFGDTDAIGKTVNVADDFDLKVSGVFQDVPRQSSLAFDAVLPFALQFAPHFQEPTHWGGNPLETYIRMVPGALQEAVTAKINTITAEHFQKPGFKIVFHLLPLFHKHLHHPEGNLADILRLFAAVALLVLAIACVNFMNLSTAMAATRTKEVGVRRVVGARRKDLIGQFLGESLLLSFCALGIALALLYLILPAFNHIAGKALSMRTILDPATISGFLAVTIFAALAAGSYPAFYLTGIRPKAVIQGKASDGAGIRGKRLRASLVVFQFVLSVILILTTIAIAVQLRYIKTKDLGFDRHNLLSLRLSTTLLKEYASLKTELLRHPAVEGVTADWQNPMNISSTVAALEWEGKNPNETLSMHFDQVGYDYFETMKIPLALGRTFSPHFPADESEGYIVNEAAVKMMGVQNPIGQSLSVFGKPGRIIGVVRDFHFQPLRHRIHPIVFMLKPAGCRNILIRFNPLTVSEAVHHIGATFKKFDPQQTATFQYTFFDEQMMQSQYDFEVKIQVAALIFTILAVLIACAGLFALAAFLTEQRTREVGIRKVLGASAGQITYLLSKEFSAWVALANLFAWPVAYLLIRQLFAIYAYHAVIGIPFYFIAGVVTFVIAASTTGLLTMKAAQSNPIHSLRYE